MKEQQEQRYFRGFRWWPIDEIAGSGEVFAPRRLGELLQSLRDDGPPAAPLDAGV